MKSADSRGQDGCFLTVLGRKLSPFFPSFPPLLLLSLPPSIHTIFPSCHRYFLSIYAPDTVLGSADWELSKATFLLTCPDEAYDLVIEIDKQ